MFDAEDECVLPVLVPDAVPAAVPALCMSWLYMHHNSPDFICLKVYWTARALAHAQRWNVLCEKRWKKEKCFQFCLLFSIEVHSAPSSGASMLLHPIVSKLVFIGVCGIWGVCTIKWDTIRPKCAAALVTSEGIPVDVPDWEHYFHSLLYLTNGFYAVGHLFLHPWSNFYNRIIFSHVDWAL